MQPAGRLPSIGRATADRVGRFFAVEDPWERPGRLTPADLVTGGITAVISGLALELYRSAGALQHATTPSWAQWLAVLCGAALLVGRRRWPLTVATLAAAHMFVVGVTMPAVMGQVTMQLVYFLAFCSAVAWARNRREMVIVFGLLMVFMTGWLAWQFALGSGIDEARQTLGEDAERSFGPVPPVTALVLLTALVNLLYFGGAAVLGQLLWRTARQSARLADQADQIADQAEQLRRRAVIGERLRIARELHDVVAHHVSVIGIQAGAARRVLDRANGTPDSTGTPTGRNQAIGGARTALTAIEQSSREAVSQMRGLLGTLRADEADGGDRPGAERIADPGLEQLPELVAAHRRPGFEVRLDVVESPAGATQQVAGPLAHTLCRTVQEALTNVERHSTASRATVVLRVDAPAGFAEVEVTDDGRPRDGAGGTGTSGSGLGQLGIRERAATLRGQVEIGPRVTGGYRVRVRLPLAAPALDAPTDGVRERR